MNGISLSLLRLSPEMESYLLAPTTVAAWPRAVVPAFPGPVDGVKVSDTMEGVPPSKDDVVERILVNACQSLIDSTHILDELDGKVGDADCGSTIACAAKKVLEMKHELPLADPKSTCRCLASLTGKMMGGSSGVLMSIMFMGMADSFETSGKKDWKEGGANALMDGLKAMMEAGGASRGSRTMLDALLPAAEALLAKGSLSAAKEAAASGAESTKEMVPRAGRAENVPESVWRGVTDPGAQAVAIVFAAIG